MVITPFAVFLKTQLIEDSSIIFTEFEKHKFKFYYFQINQVYYLFFYGKKEKYYSIDHLYKTIAVIEELDTKQRKIRSLRGFFLYALETLESAEDKNINVLETNLSIFFWRRVKNVIRQNNKGLLLNFLFEVSKIPGVNEKDSLEQTIENLQIEVLDLKNKLVEIEYSLKGL